MAALPEKIPSWFRTRPGLAVLGALSLLGSFVAFLVRPSVPSLVASAAFGFLAFVAWTAGLLGPTRESAIGASLAYPLVGAVYFLVRQAPSYLYMIVGHVLAWPWWAWWGLCDLLAGAC